MVEIKLRVKSAVAIWARWMLITIQYAARIRHKIRRGRNKERQEGNRVNHLIADNLKQINRDNKRSTQAVNRTKRMQESKDSSMDA